MNLLTQYILVFVILAGVVVWILVRLLRRKSGGGCGCSGCSLSASCKKAEIVKKRGCDECEKN